MLQENMRLKTGANKGPQSAGNVCRQNKKNFFMPGGRFRGLGVSLATALLGGCLFFSLPAAVFAQDKAAQGNEDEPQGAFIGKNEDGDAIMRTAPRPREEQRPYNDYYRDGIILSPEVRPIIPLPPGPRPPHNPYPGPGPHPGPQPRDGVNQLHEYNYNPQYPQEVPRVRPGRG